MKKKEKLEGQRREVSGVSVAAIADFVFKREGIATSFLCLHIFPAIICISDIKSLQYNIQTLWPMKVMLPNCFLATVVAYLCFAKCTFIVCRGNNVNKICSMFV